MPPDPQSPPGTPAEPERAAWTATPFALPTGLLLVRGLASVVAVAAVGTVIGGLLRPGAGWSSALQGGLAAAAGIAGGILVITPWKPRPVTIWPALLLGGQGAGLVAALLTGLLLYSSSRPGEPLIFGAVLAVGYTAGMLAMATLFGRIVANRGP